MATNEKIIAAERRAKREAIAVGLAGAVLTVVGFASVLIGPPVAAVWLIMLSILGPVTIFLALVWYGTFLERIEEDRYFPPTGDVRPAGPRASH